MPLSFRGKRLILKAIAAARRFRFWLAAGVAILLFFQITAFTPKKLEEESAPAPINQEDLKPREEEGSFVAPTIPQNEVPEYTVEGLQYVSTQAGVKQWRLQGERAYFYQTEGIVHARDVNADLYDANGQKTIVTAKEAKYFMESRNLELFGDVHSIFPSGIESFSQYMHYEAKTKNITIPAAYTVTGNSVNLPDQPPPPPRPDGSTERFDYRSNGLKYLGELGLLYLLSNVEVHVIKEYPKNPKKDPEITTIDSDLGEIDKRKNIGKFSMLEARPSDQRFVLITQPGMTSKSRRAEFRINADSKKLRTVVAIDDVKIREIPQKSSDYATNAHRRSDENRVRYATAGVAEFDTQRNLIFLREYPQVYQDRDTITGDTIIVHRDSDLVEVDQSNAFTEGQTDEEKATKKNPEKSEE